MFRRPRLKLDGIPIHIIQRGSNRNACFYADEDDQFYLESLDKYCHDEKVKVQKWSAPLFYSILKKPFSCC